MGNLKLAVAVLDIGSTGVRMLVGRIMENGTPKIIAKAECPALETIDILGDLKKSDLKRCVEKVVETILQKTGIEVQSVYVSLPNYYVRRISGTGELKFDQPTSITGLNIGEVLNEASAVEYDDEEETLVDIVPIAYYADGNLITDRPEGTVCTTLSLDAAAIVVKNSYLLPLEEVFKDIGLKIDGYVPSFLSIQKVFDSYVFFKTGENHCFTMIADVGGSTTEYSVYYNGIPFSFGTIRMAGNNISRDLQLVLSIPPKQAMRLKINYPFATPKVVPTNLSVTLDRPEIVEQEDVAVSYVAEIMQARIEEIASKTYDAATQKMKAEYISSPMLNKIYFIGDGIINFNGVGQVLERVIPQGTVEAENRGRKLGIKNSFTSSLGMLLYIASKMKYGRRPSAVVNRNETIPAQTVQESESQEEEQETNLKGFFKKLFKF